MEECYIRGSNVKYLRIPDDAMEKAKNEGKKAYRMRLAANKRNERGGKARSGPNSNQRGKRM